MEPEFDYTTFLDITVGNKRLHLRMEGNSDTGAPEMVFSCTNVEHWYDGTFAIITPEQAAIIAEGFMRASGKYE